MRSRVMSGRPKVARVVTIAAPVGVTSSPPLGDAGRRGAFARARSSRVGGAGTGSAPWGPRAPSPPPAGPALPLRPRPRQPPEHRRAPLLVASGQRRPLDQPEYIGQSSRRLL